MQLDVLAQRLALRHRGADAGQVEHRQMHELVMASPTPRAAASLMPATVLDHVTSKMRIYREETFGPVKRIVRVSGIAEFTELRWITIETGERH
jgi:acyl-CoA reductase-like NAD-dependent aldehyde dehydrogenase